MATTATSNVRMDGIDNNNNNPRDKLPPRNIRQEAAAFEQRLTDHQQQQRAPIRFTTLATHHDVSFSTIASNTSSNNPNTSFTSTNTNTNNTSTINVSFETARQNLSGCDVMAAAGNNCSNNNNEEEDGLHQMHTFLFSAVTDDYASDMLLPCSDQDHAAVDVVGLNKCRAKALEDTSRSNSCTATKKALPVKPVVPPSQVPSCRSPSSTLLSGTYDDVVNQHPAVRLFQNSVWNTFSGGSGGGSGSNHNNNNHSNAKHHHHHKNNDKSPTIQIKNVTHRYLDNVTKQALPSASSTPSSQAPSTRSDLSPTSFMEWATGAHTPPAAATTKEGHHDDSHRKMPSPAAVVPSSSKTPTQNRRTATLLAANNSNNNDNHHKTTEATPSTKTPPSKHPATTPSTASFSSPDASPVYSSPEVVATSTPVTTTARTPKKFKTHKHKDGTHRDSPEKLLGERLCDTTCSPQSTNSAHDSCNSSSGQTSFLTNSLYSSPFGDSSPFQNRAVNDGDHDDDAATFNTSTSTAGWNNGTILTEDSPSPDLLHRRRRRGSTDDEEEEEEDSILHFCTNLFDLPEEDDDGDESFPDDEAPEDEDDIETTFKKSYGNNHRSRRSNASNNNHTNSLSTFLSLPFGVRHTREEDDEGTSEDEDSLFETMRQSHNNNKKAPKGIPDLLIVEEGLEHDDSSLLIEQVKRRDRQRFILCAVASICLFLALGIAVLSQFVDIPLFSNQDGNRNGSTDVSGVAQDEGLPAVPTVPLPIVSTVPPTSSPTAQATVMLGVKAASTSTPTLTPSTAAPTQSLLPSTSLAPTGRYVFGSNTRLRQAILDYQPGVDEPVNDWDVSGVTDFSGVFADLIDFNEPIGQWNVSAGTSFEKMFSYATAFNQDLSAWDLRQAQDLSHMFFQASSFDQAVAAWDVGRVTNAAHMFYGAERFNHSVSDWDLGSMQDMQGMFQGVSLEYPNAFDQNLCGWKDFLYPPQRIIGINAMNLFQYTSCPHTSTPGATPHVTVCHECPTTDP